MTPALLLCVRAHGTASHRIALDHGTSQRSSPKQTLLAMKRQHGRSCGVQVGSQTSATPVQHLNARSNVHISVDHTSRARVLKTMVQPLWVRPPTTA